MKFFLIIFLFFFFAQGHSQNIPLDKTADALREYFKLPRENIFLHVNKTDFVKGENIWFKGYVLNTLESLPFEETSNVYIGLYNEEGQQIKKNLYLAKDGYFQGNFEIDSTYSAGDVYIKAETNWMRNFNEKNSFIEKLRIVDGIENVNISNSQNSILDVQFLPEGGHLVSNVINTVGVKILNENGYGVAVNDVGIIDGSTGEQVALFSTNRFGHGKFRLSPQLSTIYTAVKDFQSGESFEFKLPLADRKGLVLELKNSSYQDKIPVLIKTNYATIGSLKDKNFYALIYKENREQRIDIEFVEDSLATGFFISKKDIPLGVNTVTIFTEENEPILERMFFNTDGLSMPELTAKIKDANQDSLSVNLQIKGDPKNLVNFSASILPMGTSSYNHRNNIQSAFYLAPYLSGFVENPSYYFKNKTAKKEYELDLLLLNQGWSAYKWDRIFNAPPVERFDFERGITLNINLNEKVTEDKSYYIFPTINHLEKEVTINEGQEQFQVSNFYLQNGEEVNISEMDKNELKKPKVYITSVNTKTLDRLNPWPSNFTNERNLNTIKSENFILPTGLIALDEVTVTEDKLLKKAKANINVQPFLKNKITPVTEETVFQFPTILDLIRSRGYVILETPGLITITSRRALALGLPEGLELIIDGVRQPDLYVLKSMNTEEIESYFFDRNNIIPGVVNGFKEKLFIYFRRGGNFLSSNLGRKKLATTYFVENGFMPKKSYYTPKYKTFSDETFSRIGVIHWEPEIRIVDNQANFKILNTGLSNFKIFLEGMDAEGNLYSYEQEMSLKSD